MDTKLRPFLFFFLLPIAYVCCGQSPIRPAYCEQPPASYSTGNKPKSLPVFGTRSTLEYRVQVAVLRNSDPRTFQFHNSLAARYQPCEQVWIVESKKTFRNRSDAERLEAELERLGYPGSYITTIVAYE